MLSYYFVLDVPLDASDDDIRSRYIEKVKKYTPEREPEKFRRISEAYEGIKNERRRVASKLLGGLGAKDYEAALLELAKAREVKKRRANLRELFEAEANT